VDKVQRKKITLFRPLSVGENAADISRPFELDLIQQVTAVSDSGKKKAAAGCSSVCVCRHNSSSQRLTFHTSLGAC
jgi:hypothetical protein